MDNTIRYIQSPNALFQTVGPEAVLLDLATDKYFSLDDVGTVMWKLLAEHGSVDAVVTHMLREYDVEEGVLRADVSELAEKLVDAGLMTRSVNE